LGEENKNTKIPMDSEDAASSSVGRLVDRLFSSDENQNIPLEQIQQDAEKLEEWWHRAQVDGLVPSRGEEWDDIPTHQTIVALFPFLLGLAKIARGDLDEREKRIQQAISYFLVFLTLLKDMQFLSKDERKYAERAIQLFQGIPEDQHTNEYEKRQEKIDLWRQQKMWRHKLLQDGWSLSQMMAKASDDTCRVDEERQREHIANMLHLAVYKVVAMAQHLMEELQLLEYGKQQKNVQEQSTATSQAVFLGRMRFHEPIVKQPPAFRIPKDDPCFPLHHHHHDDHTPQSQQSKPAKEEKDDDEDDKEEDIYKQRKWDDWKDDHNKGSGNSLR
jgi:hypothetical protein